MTLDQALAFVERHGAVLASAKGPVPSLAEAIAGEPIRGSWWGHPKGRAIYAIFQQIEDDPDILVCRLVNGKISFVHRRLWPALARLSDRFPAEHLAQLRQEHTASGRHENRIVAFADWITSDIARAAADLDEAAALAALGDWISPSPTAGSAKRGA